MNLLPQHQRLIVASGIAPEVAEARGYRSVTQPAVLKGLGFNQSQSRLVPCLLIPIWNVHGELHLHQIRPDYPRQNREGKCIKYETPSGKSLCLDVPPAALPHIGNPEVPLWFTEGSRKADAAISHGIACCISLMGVWGWKGTNLHGGKVALTDFHAIALNGRKVFLCFDSDVIVKKPVHYALNAFKHYLESRKAHVMIVRLPQCLPGMNAEGGSDV